MSDEGIWFDEAMEIANSEYDGHLTIMKFSTNWRVGFGTPSAFDYVEYRGMIQRMPVGITLEDACARAVKSRFVCE
jgi:hypothetical protein